MPNVRIQKRQIAGRLAWIAVLFVTLSMTAHAGDPRVEVEVQPTEATIGDALSVTISLTLPEGSSFEPPRIGPEIGAFTVTSGSWIPPEPRAEEEIWTWAGSIAVFRLGEHELPAVRFQVGGPDGTIDLATEPVTVQIRSVLEGQSDQEEFELADLKAPASIGADFGPLWVALGILGVLLLGAGLIWWLNHRYGHKLAAVAVPEDPFHRTPPHVWVYAELQTLLERRLAEDGQIDAFYGELSRILKRYLGGRYRVDLMERTTHEVPEALRQAGAPAESVSEVVQLLEQCDLVKFANLRPLSSAWREAVESVYRIVDATKPADSGERGAA